MKNIKDMVPWFCRFCGFRNTYPGREFWCSNCGTERGFFEWWITSQPFQFIFFMLCIAAQIIWVMYLLAK